MATNIEFTIMEIKKDFAGGLYDEILKMESTKKVKELVDATSEFVRTRCKEKYISTSQLRNIYDKLLKVKEENYSQVQLLRPKLAYVAARQNKAEAKEIVNFFNEIISKISSEDELRSFKIFFESVVAYHKFHSLKQEKA
jgi:CRISPR-associated protein Csm2